MNGIFNKIKDLIKVGQKIRNYDRLAIEVQMLNDQVDRLIWAKHSEYFNHQSDFTISEIAKIDNKLELINSSSCYYGIESFQEYKTTRSPEVGMLIKIIHRFECSIYCVMSIEGNYAELKYISGVQHIGNVVRPMGNKICLVLPSKVDLIVMSSDSLGVEERTFVNEDRRLRNKLII